MAGRPSFSITEYEQLARQLDLTFIGATVPQHIKDKTYWRCNNCGAELHKSFHYLKYSAHPCRCRNGMSLPRDSYQHLGEKLGIDFGGIYIPRNVFEVTQWINKSNVVFDASYHDLAYGKIPQRLREYVETS